MSRLDLWREGFAAGTRSGRDGVRRQFAAARQQRNVAKLVALVAAAVVPDHHSATFPDGFTLAEGLLVIAERELPCTCLPDYTNRGLVDPMCRHDDRDDLIAAVVEYVNRVRDGSAYPSAASRAWGLTDGD